MSNEEQTIKRKFSTKQKILLIVISVIIVASILFALLNINGQKKYDYIELANTASSQMMYDAATIEDQYNLIQSVWYDAIYEDYNNDTKKYVIGASDFNDALDNLYNDDDFTSINDKLTENKYDIDEYMESLKDVPEDCEEYHDYIIALYSEYNSLYNMVIIPSGSYNDYTDKFAELENDFLDAYTMFQNKVPSSKSE